MKDVQNKFTDIFETQLWQSGESVSGSGSETEQTAVLIEHLYFFAARCGIKTIVDWPCGDFHYMNVAMENLSMQPFNCKYKGFDIVEALIEANKVKYPDYEFEVGDIIKDPIPSCDLLIVRDCFVHLSTEMVFDAIENILKHDIKYVGFTTFTDRVGGEDECETQHLFETKQDFWRPINLMADPYNLPCPWYMIVENCTEADGAYYDKCLAIYDVELLKLLAPHLVG